MISFFLLLVAVLLLWLQSFKSDCKSCKKLGLSFLGTAYIFQLLELIESFRTGQGNIYLSISVLVLTIFYFLCWKFRKNNISSFSPLIATVAFLFTLAGLKLGFFQRKDFLTVIHVYVIILALSLLLLSSIASFFKTISERTLKSGSINLPFEIPITFWNTIEQKFFFLGFVLLTVDLIFNFLLLRKIEGRVEFDSRIVGSFLLWLYYGLLFHLKRFGIKTIKERFYLFNLLGGFLILILLFFTRHNF